MDALLCLKGFSNPSSILEKLIFFIKEVRKIMLSRRLVNSDAKRSDEELGKEKGVGFELRT